MLKITEMWIRKGKDFHEDCAKNMYGKTFYELNEEEKNKIMGLRIKAKCSIVLNNYVKIEKISIAQSSNGLILIMPSKKMSDGNYKDIVYCLNMEFKEYLQKRIFELYNSENNHYTDNENVYKIETTEVQVRLIKSETKVKAKSRVILDSMLCLNDIEIYEVEKGLGILKPTKKASNGEYEKIFSFINEDDNKKINDLILKEYKNQINKINQSANETHVTADKIELSSADKKRIEKNISILKEKGLPYNENMLNIPTSKNLIVESKENIYTKLLFDYASATMAYMILERKGNYEGVYDIVMETLQKKHQILNWLTEAMKNDLLQYKNGAYNPDNLLSIAWKYEECAVYLWSLGLIDKPKNDAQCMMGQINNLLYYIEDCENFINKCILKDKEDIIEFADMVYRMEWAYETERLQGKEYNNTCAWVVYYQKRAVRWIMFLE